MGEIGAKLPEKIGVIVQSDWWSRINWAQVVGWICSALALLTANKFDVSAEWQAGIVLVVQGIAAIATIYFRRYTTTITPAAAAMIKEEQDAHAHAPSDY